MASRGRDFLGGLSEDSADQILGFMRFFQLKRESFLSLVASEFEEAADMLDESEYTRAEVKAPTVPQLFNNSIDGCGQ